MRSASSGLRLWGIARRALLARRERLGDLARPRCAAGGGSRCAIFSSEARDERQGADELGVAVALHDLGRAGSRLQAEAARRRSSSTSGGTLAWVPTAPEILPTAIVVARALAGGRWWRRISATQTASLRPKVVGSAWMPWVRPIITVRLWRTAWRARTALERVRGRRPSRSQRLDDAGRPAPCRARRRRSGRGG